jgi:hypothetical protein
LCYNAGLVTEGCNTLAPVAQLDRVFGYEPKGRAFESLRARQIIKALLPKEARLFYFSTAIASNLVKNNKKFSRPELLSHATINSSVAISQKIVAKQALGTFSMAGAVPDMICFSFVFSWCFSVSTGLFGADCRRYATGGCRYSPVFVISGPAD